MNENEPIEVSKSQRKREANELLEIAKRLVTMPDARLKRMPLGEDLRREVDFARKIRAHGARKRQLMTVAKKLRRSDIDDLLEAVHDIDNKDRKLNARHHHIEAWRVRLIEGDDQQLADFLATAEGINAQTLRQLIRNARKEAKLNKPPTASRKLFKMLREADELATLPRF